MHVTPQTVRPGEVVTFVLAARNAGFQDALVALTDTLPSGLSVVTETLAPNITYDPATRTLAWPPRLLWPGESVHYAFQARAAAGLPKTTLENSATAHAYWPNTDLLPAGQRQLFTSREQTVTFKAAVGVDPALPADADTTPPWVGLFVRGRPADQLGEADVPLSILAADDAAWMYLREWAADPTTGAWSTARNSGWIAYTPTYTWTLSAGQGVKYIGVWVADASRNASHLSETSLALVNRIDGSQALTNGQRVQYRGDLHEGAQLHAYLTTVSGDPDLYAWGPFNPFRPDRLSNESVAPGQYEGFGGDFLHTSGRYLLEVQAVGASEYTLALGGHGPASTAAAVTAKDLPQRPLVVSDPLSAGVAVTPPAPWKAYLYLPLTYKGG
jgi:uncharacterized repeat protein (TIGR01451 family)